jgi:phage terminase large subunit GpA-like protein
MEITDIRRNALRSLIPPPRLQLSDWIEANIKLPEGVSASPGAIRLYPYQREIADAISDPEIERITMVKAARLGFTTLLSGAVGAYVANEPSPIMCLLPTDADCRDYVVSDIEPIFAASPVLKENLAADTEEGERLVCLRKKSFRWCHSTTNGFSIRSALSKVLWDRHYFGCETVMSHGS